MDQKSAPLPKAELKRQIKKFILDGARGISLEHFANLCGISKLHMLDVFKYEREPLTENVQIRVNRGYEAWKKGIVRVMKRRDNTRYVDYRKEPLDTMMPRNKLILTNNGIKLKVGMHNRHDYSDYDLNERG